LKCSLIGTGALNVRENISDSPSFVLQPKSMGLNYERRRYGAVRQVVGWGLAPPQEALVVN
jgi:hypothetical protein